jgi:hypothetical protein
MRHFDPQRKASPAHSTDLLSSQPHGTSRSSGEAYVEPEGAAMRQFSNAVVMALAAAFFFLPVAAKAQTAADVAAAVNNMCAVMAGQTKADSRTLQYLLLLDEDMGEANPVSLALYRGVLHQCPKAYVAFEQRKRASNPFANSGLTKGSPTQLTGSATAAPARVFAMRCHGGRGIASAQGATLIVQFTGSAKAAAQGLAPGQCAWADRGLRAGEPTKIVVPLESAAQARNGVTQINTGGTWTFWVYNTKTSFQATEVAKGSPAKP